MSSHFKFGIFVVLICTGYLTANNFYVDQDAKGSRSGFSWNQAWTSFDQINWNLMSGGDTLFISGGMNTKTYSNQTMIIHGFSKSTPASPLVISKGLEHPHNGQVILEGNMQTDYGIHLDRSTSVYIQSLTVQNFINTGGIHIRWSKDIKVENCRIKVGGHGGVYIHASKSCQVTNCIITTPIHTDRQNDGIYSQWSNHNTFSDNIIIINNEDIDQHCDAIQCYVDTNSTIFNNYVEQNNHKLYNCQGLYANDCYGDIIMYNNVVYAPNSENTLLCLSNDRQGNGRLIAYHNTLFGGKWGTIKIINAPGSIVKNNIAVSYFNPCWIVRLEGPLSYPENIDYNCYYVPNTKAFLSIDQRHTTWQQWKSRGYDDHSIYANPILADVKKRNFGVDNTSPVIGQGILLPPPFNIDKVGNIREKHQVDMGAFQTGSYKIQSPTNLRFSR